MAMLLILAAIALALLMAAAWGVQRLTGRSGWIDTIWTASTAIVGAALVLSPTPGVGWPEPRQALVAVLALCWGGRLALDLFRRTLKGGEDPRYAALQAEWGDRAASRLLWFAEIQAAAALLLVAAMFAASRNSAPFPGPGDALGVVTFAIAIVGAGLADRQMAWFRSDPANRGRVCRNGLWAWSRHPNYFFEWLGWLAWPLIALLPAPPDAFALISLAAPLLMYWLLAHVSGVPPLEAHMLRSRGAAFATYQRQVNAFFPGPRRLDDEAAL